MKAARRAELSGEVIITIKAAIIYTRLNLLAHFKFGILNRLEKKNEHFITNFKCLRIQECKLPGILQIVIFLTYMVHYPTLSVSLTQYVKLVTLGKAVGIQGSRTTLCNGCCCALE